MVGQLYLTLNLADYDQSSVTSLFAYCVLHEPVPAPTQTPVD